MCRICTEDMLPNWRNIKEKIKQLIHDIDSHFQISKIILHGSFARGDYHENSDVDLIIIGDFKERFFDRIGKILDLAPDDLIIEPMVYNEEEIYKMIKDENPFILTAIKEGITLLDNT